MNKPLVSLSLLLFASGCSSSPVGRWEGELEEVCVSETEHIDGGSYKMTSCLTNTEIDMELGDNHKGSADWATDLVFEVTNCSWDSSCYDVFYGDLLMDGDAEVTESGDGWELVLDMKGGMSIDMAGELYSEWVEFVEIFDCAIGGDLMECESAELGGLLFRRK